MGLADDDMLSLARIGEYKRENPEQDKGENVARKASILTREMLLY